MTKRLLLIALITISFIESYCQSSFEKGYFIDESNQKIECLIKNVDWKNNPTEFKYKLSENTEIQEAGIQTVKEFGVNNNFKYIRAKINIDRSSDQISKMNKERNPSFQEEVLFLKVLIEGNASLLFYRDGNLTRFFYKKDDSGIEQLVYKKYRIDEGIAINNYFLQQLTLKLKCEAITLKELERLKYHSKDLEKLFVKYNECVDADYINYKSKQNRDVFNLSIRPGINYRSLSIRNILSSRNDTDFDHAIGMRLGVEAEFVLPYHKNKWSIIIEPTYQYFQSTKARESSTVSGGIFISKADYSSIEVPVGVRHYFYLNDDSKIFLNASGIFDFALNTSIDFMAQDGAVFSSLTIEPRMNLAMGLGYKFKNKYGLELRYHTSRNVLGNYLYWTSDYRVFSIIIGYSIF